MYFVCKHTGSRTTILCFLGETKYISKSQKQKNTATAHSYHVTVNGDGPGVGFLKKNRVRSFCGTTLNSVEEDF